MKLLLFALAASIFFQPILTKKPTVETTTTGSLIYRFSKLPSKNGVIRVVLYDQSEQFFTEHGWCRADSSYIQTDGSAAVKINNLAYGKYAAALYLDENQNGQVDKNLVGMPSEAYGFSNAIRAKWSIPSFEKVLFDFKNEAETVQGRVEYWSKQ